LGGRAVDSDRGGRLMDVSSGALWIGGGILVVVIALVVMVVVMNGRGRGDTP